MAWSNNSNAVALALDEVDKNVQILQGTIDYPATAAGTEGIIDISHSLGKTALPEGYFSYNTLGIDITVPPNYQYGDVVFNLSCSSTVVRIQYYKLSSVGGTATYFIKLIAKD